MRTTFINKDGKEIHVIKAWVSVELGAKVIINGKLFKIIDIVSDLDHGTIDRDYYDFDTTITIERIK